MSRVLQKEKYTIYPMAFKEEVVKILEDSCLKEDGRIKYNAAELLAQQLEIGSRTILHWLSNKLKYGTIERRAYIYDDSRKQLLIQRIKEACLQEEGRFNQRKARIISVELGIPFNTLKNWFYRYIKPD